MPGLWQGIHQAKEIRNKAMGTKNMLLPTLFRTVNRSSPPGRQMTWNYRIFRHREKATGLVSAHTWYGLHEVFYNDEGEPETYALPPEVAAATLDELLSSLRLMLKD